MGVGFPRDKPHDDPYKNIEPPPRVSPNHKFICGNHDNYQYASKFPNCLKRFGYIEDMGIFYISGGLSIDKAYRTPNRTWWACEELYDNEMNECLALYEKTKPEIVCSHECPTIAKYWALFYKGNKLKKNMTSRTETFLNILWCAYEPKYWVHGHYHQFYKKIEGRTLFVGLDELLEGKKENTIFEITT